jgi:hypothetical protein
VNKMCICFVMAKMQACVKCHNRKASSNTSHSGCFCIYRICTFGRIVTIVR